MLECLRQAEHGEGGVGCHCEELSGHPSAKTPGLVSPIGAADGRRMIGLSFVLQRTVDFWSVVWVLSWVAAQVLWNLRPRRPQML